MRNSREKASCSITGLSQSAGFAFPPAAQIAIKIEQHIGVVNDTVHHCGHNEGSGYIEDGVLFDKHRRKDD